jgi:lipopolysaccharide/colanic/teichoic acid biosynthesis glycosyltransferase
MSSLSSGQPFFADTSNVTIIRSRLNLQGEMTEEQEVLDGLESVACDEISGFSICTSPWVGSKMRRCIDCSIATGVILLLAPFLPLIALLIKITSAGPVFFRQRRMGRHGNEFTLYKLRSMRVEDEPGSPITVEGDLRITPIGAFLRRWKLDELPQFWNVVKGDMSLVGPRPKLPHHEGLHLPCRPGITGPATLAFKDEEKILVGIPGHKLDDFYDQYIKPVKARIDREYMETATLHSDLSTLVQTVVSCTGTAEVRISGTQR